MQSVISRHYYPLFCVCSRPLLSIAKKMSSPVQSRLHSYDEAIKALNSLQTNSEHLQQVIQERQKYAHLNVPRTLELMDKSGMSATDLDSLRVIHISGTKGKGSTGAFLESILRRHGLKTGFYSSPHLVAATERIRIDGAPISQEKFSTYCTEIFEKLCINITYSERPPYFQFLTILAYHIFWRENVDVAIMEVGIGGSYDTTNVVRYPVVCGITSLGIDHVSILGNTIEEIAWHKAGIMKKERPAFVDYEQPKEGMEVLEKRASEIGATLLKIPELSDYDWGVFPKELSLFGQVQERNASLALQLSRAFLNARQGHENWDNLTFKLDIFDALGLRLTSWPGRSQTVKFDDVTFFLDGAHTMESIEACTEWFKIASRKICQNGFEYNAKVNGDSQVSKILMFNVTKDRQGGKMLELLANENFDLVIFCSTMSRRLDESDNTNHMTNMDIQLKRCQDHQQHWKLLKKSESVIIPYINDALAWITQGRKVPLLTLEQNLFENESLPNDLEFTGQLQILVTGSFHLVGGVLELIQPDVFYKSNEDLRREDEIAKVYYSLQSGCIEKKTFATSIS